MRDTSRLFTGACGDRTSGDRFKLKDGRFRSDRYKKKFFALRVVSPWPRLPREAVAVPSLAGFKTRLNGALSTLGWWKVFLPLAGGWNWMIFKVPSNPNQSMILCSRGFCPSQPEEVIWGKAVEVSFCNQKIFIFCL